MRVTVLPPWPNTIMALRLSFWVTCSFGSIAASNQRVDGMPGVSMYLTGLPSAAVPVSNRPAIQSYSTSHTRHQWRHAPSARP